MDVTLSDTKLGEIVAHSWNIMLGIDLSNTDTPVDDSGNEKYVTGCISIVGGIKYAVFLDCSLPLLKHATALMFDMGEDEITDEELEDALGELTNMAGGAIQQTIDSNSQLSLPVVTDARSHTLKIPATRKLVETKMTHDKGDLLITLVRGKDARKPRGPK